MKLFNRRRDSELKLVIGLNQVDKMLADGWDSRLNAPTKEAEKEIQRRAEDAIAKLASFADISADHLEYYSATRRYRLLPLLTKVIGHARAGFKLDQVRPADPFELADEEVRIYANELRRQPGEKSALGRNLREEFLENIKRALSMEDANYLDSRLSEEMMRPPKVAVLGKAGVGKTTTINALFNVKWETSHTRVGTTRAQLQEFSTEEGGNITVIDLPGYGRSVVEDSQYEAIYRNLIPTCDLVLLVLQADSRDFADDQEMLVSLRGWLKN